MALIDAKDAENIYNESGWAARRKEAREWRDAFTAKEILEAVSILLTSDDDRHKSLCDEYQKVIARQMIFQFLRPVFAGDIVQCEVTIVRLEPAEQVTRLTCQWVCRNQDGKEVMTGQADGIIRT